MKSLVILSIAFISATAMSAERPQWITNPFEFCPPTELCAVGESTGAMGAEATARNNLAKTFETKISSASKFTTTAEQKQRQDVISGSVHEDSSIAIEEMTEEILKGVVIKERYSDKTTFYALASLNKNKGAEAFRTEISSLDEKVKALWQDGRRSSLSKILKLYKTRDALHFRYNFLKGDKIEKPVKEDEIYAKKKAKKALGTVLYFSFEDAMKGEEIRNVVVGLLSDQDYKIVRTENASFEYKVKGSLTSEKQHMNVEGFEKYSFLLTLTAYNKEGQEIGHLKVEDAETGRNLKQAYENALPYLKKSLNENLSDLNID